VFEVFWEYLICKFVDLLNQEGISLLVPGNYVEVIRVLVDGDD
jgi:hypothetical protein